MSNEFVDLIKVVVKLDQLHREALIITVKL